MLARLRLMYIIQISFPLSRMRLLLKWLTGVQRMFLFEPTWHQSCSSIVFARLMYFILVYTLPVCDFCNEMKYFNLKERRLFEIHCYWYFTTNSLWDRHPDFNPWGCGVAKLVTPVTRYRWMHVMRGFKLLLWARHFPHLSEAVYSRYGFLWT